MKNQGDETKESLLTDHEYDGIREYDNQLPSWWLWGFYLTIVFAALYWGYYEISDHPGLEAEYASEREAHGTRYENPAKVATGGTLDESALIALSRDVSALERGRATYQKTCVACHGDKGQGGIGPNLTDAFWLHGAKLTDRMKVITDGVSDKGMPPWGPVLSAQDIQATTAYLRTLEGTNVPGDKAPQGTRP